MIDYRDNTPFSEYQFFGWDDLPLDADNREYEGGIKLRMRFEKSGSSVYMSHLDLMRTLQRGFSRAGLPLKYSEGFNPHPQISIAVPLPVGMHSVCELMDFTLIEGGADLWALPEILNRALPVGVKVQRVYRAERPIKELSRVSVYGKLFYDTDADQETIRRLESFFAKESIVIMKKSKRGLRESDIAPAIHSPIFVLKDGVAIVMAVLSVKEPSVSSAHIIEALRQLEPDLAPTHTRFLRVKTLDAKLKYFY